MQRAKQKQHHLDLSHSAKCCIQYYPESRISETGRRSIERVNEHNVKVINSHMFKHSTEANNPKVISDDFTVLNSDYRNKNFKKKVS